MLALGGIRAIAPFAREAGLDVGKDPPAGRAVHELADVLQFVVTHHLRHCRTPWLSTAPRGPSGRWSAGAWLSPARGRAHAPLPRGRGFRGAWRGLPAGRRARAPVRCPAP